ncbi:MAG: YqhA family protein [Pseudomonadota bacterium]
MFNRLLVASRFLMIVPVLGAFLGASTLLIYGGIEAVQLVTATIAEGQVSRSGAKAVAIEFIEIIDLFLLGTVFYIIAFGLYELFIEPDIGLPEWLEIQTLDDLKNKLVKVVIVVLGVLFLGHVVSWDGSTDIVYLGGGISVVVAALTWFLKSTAAK